MQASLKDIRTELKEMGAAELAEMSLRLARYKKENKELIGYLLFYADDPDRFVAEIKEELAAEFTNIPKRDFLAVKTLRKILRQVNKYTRFTGLKWIEADMALWFCRNFLEHTNTTSSYKPLRTLFNRQLVRVAKAAADLHEDLRHDVLAELDKVLGVAESSLRAFRRRDVNL